MTGPQRCVMFLFKPGNGLYIYILYCCVREISLAGSCGWRGGLQGVLYRLGNPRRLDGWTRARCSYSRNRETYVETTMVGMSAGAPDNLKATVGESIIICRLMDKRHNQRLQVGTRSSQSLYNTNDFMTDFQRSVRAITRPFIDSLPCMPCAQ